MGKILMRNNRILINNEGVFEGISVIVLIK